MNEDVMARLAAALEQSGGWSGPADPDQPDAHEQAAADRLRALLAHPATWAPPPAAVPSDVLTDEAPAAVAAPQPRRSAAPVTHLAARRRPRRRLLAAAGGVAAAVLALVVAMAWPTRESLELEMDGTALAPNAHALVAATKMGPGWELVVTVRDLPGAPEGTYYQGWAVREGGARVPLGTFHLRGPGQVKMWAGVAVDEFARVEITRQRVGGSHEPGDLFLTGEIPHG